MKSIFWHFFLVVIRIYLFIFPMFRYFPLLAFVCGPPSVILFSSFKVLLKCRWVIETIFNSYKSTPEFSVALTWKTYRENNLLEIHWQFSWLSSVPANRKLKILFVMVFVWSGLSKLSFWVSQNYMLWTYNEKVFWNRRSFLLVWVEKGVSKWSLWAVE